MKKSNTLIAVFAVIAAASAARAEVAINFDGNLGPQAMHDIFADSRQIIPSGALDQVPVPVPADPVESPIPMIEPWNIDPQPACMMVCFPGIEGYPDCCGAAQNTYTWWPQPWEAPGTCQPIPHNGNWYEMANCNPTVDWDQIIPSAQGQTKSAKSARIFHPGLQQKLREILMGYCDTYPEFAEVILPMLKKEGTKIVTHGRIVYIINGNSIIRFGGKAPAESESGASARKKPSTGLALVDAAVQAAEAVYNVVQAVNEYGSWPPVPDNGTADDYHGPALTIDDHHDDPFWTPG